MTSAINLVFLSLSRRAEASDREKLIQTFVDVGPLFALLSSSDHQIFYGRRGTGKTHALTYLADRRETAGDAVAYIDLRNVGSSAGMYSDQSRSLAERATCLLVDALSAVHESLLSYFIESELAPDLARAGPSLDALADSITEVRVVGSIETEDLDRQEQGASVSTGAAVDLGEKPSVKLRYDAAENTGSERQTRVTRSGEERLYVNFGSTGAAFRRIAAEMGERRVWILLDEWSSIPAELQPYLADLVRRSLLPTPGVTVKIAAIEQRSRFQLARADGDYVGIEVGADASADVNLDDFMVFDNDAERAKAFFRDLLYRHYQAATPSEPIQSANEFIRRAFTQFRAFDEFVRASEGVPRDAINILGLSAQKAIDDPISIEHVRVAAKNWYQRDKDTAVRANQTAHDLLHWIIDEVIAGRRARAFLLQSSVSDPIVEDLYDARVLHVLKRGISTHDQPGIRYDAYKLDYGCYVDLISTAKAPIGLLPSDVPGPAPMFIEVPPDDYRSIRRAILDLSKFRSAPHDESEKQAAPQAP